MKEKVEKICLSSIKARGWTQKLIDELLPEPQYVRNPHYSSASKMQLWKLEDVLEAEKSENFQEYKQKRDEKQQKKIEKKAKKLSELTENINIRNPALDYPNARSLDRHFVLNIGDTNTGKTYTALEALKKATTGVYLAPLRLLAMEIQDRFLSDNIPCSMITGEEENIIEGAKIMSSTVEMLSTHQIYEVGIIDECQMIADRDRGGAWTKAILGLAAKTIYLCMSPDAEEICIKLIEMCGDTYEINKCKRTTPLEYTGNVPFEKLQKNDAVILFSRREVLQFAEDVQRYGLKPSVVYGALPYKARKKQVELYNNGKTDIIVATDAIGMGMNLPIQRVIFAEITKFDGISRRNLLPNEIKQIAGRAGRRGIFDKGFVGVLSIVGKTNLIRDGLKNKNKQIEFAHIPFPEELLNHSADKLSQILKNWSDIQYPDIFKQQNLDITIEKVKYLEKKYKDLPNEIILKLSTVMFDEKNETLMESWQYYVHKYINKREIPFPQTYAFDLKGYEYAYKELDLYYSFHRTMGLPMNLSAILEEKENIVEKINEFLIAQNNKKRKKKKNKNKNHPHK